MKGQEGPAFGGLLIGMGLAFFLNRSGKPLWFSLLMGIAVGLAIYALSIWLKHRGMK